MKSTRRLAVVVAALCLTLVAASAFAQYQKGNIYGKVQARDGSVLPGVTVTLTGVGAPQTTVTDGQGNFRFPGLSPGTYQLQADLAGYGSAKRAGIGVRVGANADVTITMSPAAAESITVTAEAPLLDTRKTGTGANVTKIELEKIPSSRDPWTVLQSVPSVMVDRINVGGTQSGQQSNYIAKGALGRDNTWNIDGVNITDMAATGSSPTYYDFDSFEEMQVTTGGSDPRVQTPGVQLNMVTKRGTNDFKGSGRYFYTPESLSADASVPTEAASYLIRTNGVNFVRDYGGELGGPIMRDRLWFWLARADQKISQWQSQGFNADGTPQFLIPDQTILRNKNLKFNGQVVSSNSAVASYTFGDKVRNARDLSLTRPFETSYHQYGPTKVYKLEDTQIIGSSLYLTGMWSKVDGGFSLAANGGAGESAPSRWVDKDGVNHDNYFTLHFIRPQKQYRVDGSKFFDTAKMNHELKFGFGYRKTPVSSFTALPGPSHGFLSYSVTGVDPQNTCVKNGLPANCFRATIPRDAEFEYSEKYNDFYVGDTILIGNLTLQPGIRWDRQASRNLAVTLGANPILATPLTLPCLSIAPGCTNGMVTAYLPPATFNGDTRDMKWNSVAPRFGATYALGADKKTLIRASYNRYISQQGSAVSGGNPLAYTAFYFYGVDLNNDHTVQRNELMKVRTSTGVNPSDPSGLAVTRRIDYNMKVPYSDEILFGFDRELMSDFSVGVAYTYRKYHNLFQTRFEKTFGAGDYYGPSDYVLAGKTAGGLFTLCSAINGKAQTPTITGECPAGSQVLAQFTTPGNANIYALRPDVPVQRNRVVTTRPDYSQKFSGFELTATKRMSHRWMMRGNASWNDYTESCGPNAIALNPTPALGACPGGQVAPQSAGSGAFSNDFINAKWNLNLTGVFIAPWDINIGANLNARQGYPIPLRDTITGLRGGDITVVLEPIGNKRFDNVYELDLRIAKDIRIMNRASLTVSGDLFNAPNKRTVLQRETSVLQNSLSRTAGWRITELQAPRVWRLGARITY